MFYRTNRVILAECDGCGHATTLVRGHVEGWKEQTLDLRVHCPRCARTDRVRNSDTARRHR